MGKSFSLVSCFLDSQCRCSINELTISFSSLLHRPRRGAGCSDIKRVCVRLSVRTHIPGTTCSYFTRFLCMLPMSMAHSSSNGWRIRLRLSGDDAAYVKLLWSVIIVVVKKYYGVFTRGDRRSDRSARSITAIDRRDDRLLVTTLLLNSSHLHNSYAFCLYLLLQ